MAAELLNRGVGIPSRVHEAPSPEKLADLAVELEQLGYTPGDLNQRRVMASLLRDVEGDPLAWHVRMAVLRSMKRALYAADRTGHFGLAKKFYAHFTSPIRRYPDLIVHRQLAAHLAKGPTVEEIAGCCVENALRFTRRARSVEDKERIL